MQMRKMYMTTNKKIRADQHRKDAQECENAGMLDLAQVNWQMAAFLDPYREENYEDSNYR